MDKPQIVSHIEKSLNFTVYDVKWIPYSARLVTLGSTHKASGLIHVYELEGSNVKLSKEIAKQKAFKCATFGSSSVTQRHLATGDLNGQLDIWDLENANQAVYSVKAHESIINSIDGIGGLNKGYGAPELVTGSRDGNVKVWDSRQKDIPVTTMGPSDKSLARDCWAVSFGNSYNNENRCVCAGYDNGDLKLFDLRTNTAPWEENVKSGICGIEFNRKDIKKDRLVATTLDSKFHIFDVRNVAESSKDKKINSLTEMAHKGTVWTVKHTPQDSDVFMTAGGSGSMCLWKYNSSDDAQNQKMGTVENLQTSTISTQPIPAFDWSPDKQGLAACVSFDQCLRIIIVTKLNRL